MSYDSKSRRGVLPRRQSSQNESAPASAATAGRLVDVIQTLRPAYARNFKSFGEVFQYEGRPITVTFHPGAHYHLPATNQPLGLAAAHNVAERRRWSWDRGRNPGIYTVTKTVYVEQVLWANDQSGSHDELKAKVREATRPFVVYGEPDEVIDTRPATEDDVTQAIEVITRAFDRAFMAEAGVTTAYEPLSSEDNPMVIPTTFM